MGHGLYRVTACFDAVSCANIPAISAIRKKEFPLRESDWHTVGSIFVKIRWGIPHRTVLTSSLRFWPQFLRCRTLPGF